MKILLIGFFLLLPTSGDLTADATPFVNASKWLEFNGRQRANAVRAALKVVNPHADDYRTAVHGYDTMRCMDSALSGKAKYHAARKNLFMMLKACAVQTK